MTGQDDEGRPLLSAAIIVRDEAAHLAQCLTSIAGVCDEIVVVDTGSTDDSLATARSFGAVTATHEWVGDFSAARNVALDLATGRWVLYIDADERLNDVDPAAVHDELEGSDDAIALLVLFRTRPIFSPYREYRLWRHRDDVRFRGRIHETMVPDLQRLASQGWAIRPTDVVQLTHWGYEGDQRAKHRRNLPLLEQQIEQTPDRCYLWNHLGNIRSDLGDEQGALDSWRSGIELIRTRGLVDRTDVLCYVGYCLHLVRRGDDVSSLVEEIATLAPWFRTVDWIEAANDRRQGRHAAAIRPLRRLIATGTDPVDDSLAYNNHMFTDWAWDALADSLLELGDMAAAAEVYREAALAVPESIEYRTKAAALSARARRGLSTH